ncbi:MAG: hypothetical protein IPN51_00055 [Chloracidobacterium sp.]|nr:hypothetical protein [Chloracidobacterium sp.]
MAFFKDINPFLIGTCYLLVVTVLVFRDDIFATPAMKTFEASIIAALFAIIILEQNHAKRSLFKMSNNRLFTKLGKYTYGLYCLHLLAALIVLRITAKLGLNTQLWQVVFIEMPLMFLLSIGLAYLSYELYEKRFLRLKSRFSVITKGGNV